MPLLKFAIGGFDAPLLAWLLESGAICGAECEVIHGKERVFRLSHPPTTVVLLMLLLLLGVAIAGLGRCLGGWVA